MYLMHHGVKGQKWGVRRYQDSNGTWTEEGLERRRKGRADRKKYNEAYNYMTKREKELFAARGKAGMSNEIEDKEKVEEVKKTKVLPKGSELYRVSYTENEPVGKERKYVTFDKGAHSIYMDPDTLPWMKNAVDLDSLEDHLGYSIRYKAIKDIKIADDDAVHEYIASKLEDDGMKYLAYKDVVKEIGPGTGMNSNDLPIQDVMSTLNKKMAIESFIRVNARDVLFDEKYGQNTEAIDHFIKKGYDAIADVEDGGIGTSTLIILNPEDTLETLEAKKIQMTDLWDYTP